MTERKWFSGPWVVDGPDKWGNVDVATEDGFIVCEKSGANSHLIAAAPDLYEALEYALGCWEEHCKNGYDMQGDWVRDTRKALAKARGEQQ